MVTISGAAHADARPIEFSEGVLPFEKLWEIAWKPLSEQLPAFIRRRGQILSENSVIFLDPLGQPAAELTLRSSLAPDRASRRVDFELISRSDFYSHSHPVFQVHVMTRGDKLEDYPPAKMREGVLPVFPTGSETSSEVEIYSYGFLQMRLIIESRTLANGVKLLSVSPVEFFDFIFAYDEETTPVLRRFSYVAHYMDSHGSTSDYTIGARRYRVPGAIIGSETYQVNGRAVDLGMFQKEFSSFPMFIAPVIQGAIGSAVKLLDPRPPASDSQPTP